LILTDTNKFADALAERRGDQNQNACHRRR
jgi:hypothetical protein